MKVQQNIGIVNALIRITCGFTLLSWVTAKLVKRPWQDSYLLIAFLSAMKIAEGIVRFCPVTALFEEGQEMVENRHHHDDHKQTNAEEIVPHNPT
jgi:Protein of unknown function (DUF2892)